MDQGVSKKTLQSPPTNQSPLETKKSSFKSETCSSLSQFKFLCANSRNSFSYNDLFLLLFESTFFSHPMPSHLLISFPRCLNGRDVRKFCHGLVDLGFFYFQFFLSCVEFYYYFLVLEIRGIV
jgi:hypothetical protein